MAQFTIYKSSDASAPVLTGAAGSLLAVLQACLVTGYGSKTAAGWSNPVAAASSIGSFQQGAASKAGFGFVLNDNGPNVSSTYKEAWATGYKVVSGVGASVGSGSGQFPTAAQLLTTGHVVIRKSTAVSATARDWLIAADDRTVYVFIRSGDLTVSGIPVYSNFGFGEFYSYEPSGFTQNCFILGHNAENTFTAVTSGGGLDRWVLQVNTHAPAITGQYFADNISASAGSLLMYYAGDVSRLPIITATTPPTANGNVPSPNGVDSAYYINPIILSESNGNIRGRFRGLYNHCHVNTAIPDGTVITGAGDYAGRTFLCMAFGQSQGAVLLETSNTVDTN